MIILCHIDPLLGNDSEISNYKIAVAKTALQERNGVFYAVRAEIKGGPVSCCS
jgi:hypothetical protein